MKAIKIPIPPPFGIIFEWELLWLGISLIPILSPNFIASQAPDPLTRKLNKIIFVSINIF